MNEKKKKLRLLSLNETPMVWRRRRKKIKHQSNYRREKKNFYRRHELWACVRGAVAVGA